ncbi:hypothetical protein IQ06DRAFT_345885 [Phaeosphaeriaceae sp. SRC1lsM3a]|nr:hypothetical protein IQ06DRAFT_345885 [Stagonospora sp. SRC1lsM3a]
MRAPQRPIPHSNSDVETSDSDFMLHEEDEKHAREPKLKVPRSVIEVPPRPRRAPQIVDENEDSSAESPPTQRFRPVLEFLREAYPASSPTFQTEKFEPYVPYVYHPLHHEDSIRLLKIFGGSPLICEIVEVRRSESEYEALSYVWGPPVFTHKIYERTSRCYVPITENLFHALSALHKRPGGSVQDRSDSLHKPWCVWVDAVCIDQSNISERNHQVKSMAAIFSKASRVLVWLGPEECGSVFPTLKKISSCREAIDKARKAYEMPVNNPHDDYQSYFDTLVDNDAGMKEEKLANTTHRLRAAIQECNILDLGNFFATAWFTRAWVLQEFLLAESIEIYMGRKGSITFDTIALALDDLKSLEYLLPRGPLLQGTRNAKSQSSFVYADDFLQHFEIVDEMFQARKIRRAHSHDRSARNIRRTLKAAPPIRTLYQWCRMLVFRKCADERDKVYAALGLAYDDLDIIPNYSLSTADVLLDLTKKSLDAGDFSVLHDAGTPACDTTHESQPSFVPSLRPESRQNRPRPLGGHDDPRYKAGRSRMNRIQSLEGSSVRVRGVKVDDVIYTDNLADAVKDLTMGRGSPFKPQLHAAYDRAAATFRADSTRIDFPDNDMKLAFWRTINLGFVPARADVPYYKKGVNFHFLELPYRQNIAECMKHRVFFITKKGFLGLAPEWAREEDRVVIFDGAETPFLLRRATTESGEEAWRLVGDCYLEGWMIGDYFGCTVVAGSGTDERADAATYSKGITYHDTEFRRMALYTKFFTLC